jgi:hypothetical protein
MHDDIIRATRAILLDEFLPKIGMSLEPLTDDDVWWRPDEGSNSIANLLLHLDGNARQWVLGGVRGDADVRDRPAEFAARSGRGKQALLAQFTATLLDVDGVLAGLDAARLEEPRVIQGTQTTVFGAIFRVATHVAVHTGQIILLAKWRAPGRIQHYDATSTSFTPRWSPTPRNS